MIKLRSHQSRALDKLKSRDKGCVYVPTGGGKTIIMLEDLVQRLQSADSPQTVVIVAPRILLAGQLCSEFLEYIDGNSDFDYDNNYNILHVHSGETVYDSSTKSDYIREWVIARNFLIQHSIIFST